MEEFVWKYLLGPIIADAKGVETVTWNSVTAVTGYNPVNTVAYVLLAGSILYLAYRYLERMDIGLSPSTAIYSTPFILLGGTLRFIDDAQIVPFPYSIVFITPIIYLLVAAVYIPALTRLEERDLMKLGNIFLVPTVILVLVSSDIVNLVYLVSVLGLSFILTGLYYFFVDENFSTKPFVLLAFSQLFEGSASMLASVPQLISDTSNTYQPKQLLAKLFNDLFGVPGVLVMKVGVLVLGVSVIKDLEDDTLRFMGLMVLYAVGLGTGLRVFLRATAGV